MTNEKKAAIAYIVASKVKTRISAVYDYSRNKYCNYSNNGMYNQVNVYDYDRNSYLGGILPSVYDYATNSYINIDIRGSIFSGYDYETSQFFSGNIYDTMVSLYCNGQYSNYSII